MRIGTAQGQRVEIGRAWLDCDQTEGEHVALLLPAGEVSIKMFQLERERTLLLDQIHMFGEQDRPVRGLLHKCAHHRSAARRQPAFHRGRALDTLARPLANQPVQLRKGRRRRHKSCLADAGFLGQNRRRDERGEQCRNLRKMAHQTVSLN